MSAAGTLPARPAPRLVHGLALWMLVLAAAYAALLWQAGSGIATYAALWPILPVGVAGAIVANATGTGGGVVFIPVFSALAARAAMFPSEVCELVQLTPAETVGLSFVIQCFGMGVGSASWLRAVVTPGRIDWDQRIGGAALQTLAFAPMATGLPALLLTQWLVRVDGVEVIAWFKVFSISLGALLLIFAWRQRGLPKSARRLHPTHRDVWMLLLIGALGGAVTALFSVGIGEFVAVYLVLRRFPTTVAVAVAVWVSVVCVLAGVWTHLNVGDLPVEIALVAIPGAVLGGGLARGIAASLGSLWLKTLAALWIVGSSLYLIFLTSKPEVIQCV